MIGIGLLCPLLITAQIPVKGGGIDRRLIADPCSAVVLLGKATLVVTPLIHKENAYISDYRLRISPYFFKNEKGTLELNAPNATVKKLMAGNPVEFVGRAISSKNGKINKITGKATPLTKDRG